MKNIILALFFFTSLCLSAEELYFIDAHSQIDEKAKGLQEVLERMEKNGVRKTLLTTRGRRDWKEIIAWHKEYPQIVPIMRTKGGDYHDDKPKFYTKMQEQSSYNEFAGISETLLYHAQKGKKAPEVRVMFDDKRFQTILKIDLEKNWPVVLHVEFAALDSSEKALYMKELKGLLKSYPNNIFTLIHMGQLRANEVSQLLEEFANIYFLTAHTDPFTTETSAQPWVNMFENEQFKDEWKELLQKYPEHFIFALDNVFAEHWSEDYPKKVGLWRKALGHLDSQIAHKIAHENAEKLWKLNP